ncbi:MAG: hypothetical protein AAF481_02900 [Acidobacteriota bacterium]
MGTFHQGKHELHGITVVVETAGPELYVGRCDDITETRVILLDVDLHRDGVDEGTRADWLANAAKFGVWKKHDRLVLPRPQVTSVRPLGSVESAD